MHMCACRQNREGNGNAQENRPQDRSDAGRPDASPLVLMVLFFQRQIIEGLTQGAVKE